MNRVKTGWGELSSHMCPVSCEQIQAVASKPKRREERYGESTRGVAHSPERSFVRKLHSAIKHIPTDLVVAQEASDVESSSRFDFLLLHNLRRHFVA